jgi:hypothetical protein
MGDLGKVEVARGEVANGDVGEGEEKGESRVAAAAAAGGGRHGGRDRDSVAVRLLDDSGQPARGVRYLLELPDGWAKGGLSDELGGVVETLAPAGDCWLTLQ